MAINWYLGRDEAWLLAARNVLTELAGGATGATNHVGIAQGIFHEFVDLTEAQRDERYLRICYALFELDPDKYPNPEASSGGVTLQCYQ